MNGKALIAELDQKISHASAQLEAARQANQQRRSRLEAELREIDSVENPLKQRLTDAQKALKETKRAMLGPWILSQRTADGLATSGNRLVYVESAISAWNSRVWLRKVGRDAPSRYPRDTVWEWEAACSALDESSNGVIFKFGPGTGDDPADFLRLSKIVDKYMSDMGWILCDE